MALVDMVFLCTVAEGAKPATKGAARHAAIRIDRIAILDLLCVRECGYEELTIVGITIQPLEVIVKVVDLF